MQTSTNSSEPEPINNAQPATPSQEPPPPPTPEDEIKTLRQQLDFYTQALWQTIRKFEPIKQEVILPEIFADPLWEIGVTMTGNSKLRISAHKMPGITDSEMAAVIDRLNGTTRNLLAVLIELHLPHPPSYVENKIAPKLVFTPEGWVTPQDAKKSTNESQS